MASQWRITLQSGASAATVKARLRLNPSGYAPDVIGRVASYIEAVAGGVHGGRLSVVTTTVQASGTITLSSLAAADTITINGRVYTASASPSGAQQFLVTGGDTLAAAAFAAKMNADTSTVVTDVVTATAAAGVITITSIVPGNVGNAMTIAISAHGTASGGRLTGGTEDAPVTLYNGL